MIARRPTWHSAWQECFDANHVTVSAFRTVTQGFSGEQLVAITVVHRHVLNLDNGCGFRKQLPATGQLGRTVSVGQKAVMPNPLKSGRQNV